MRLDKLLSNLKYGSRKDVKTLIKNHQIKVNNEIVNSPSIKINPSKDIIFINDEEVIYHKIINLMIYKPIGYLSANKDNMHQTVMELLEEDLLRYDLKIAGRLDLTSEGLLILTSSGRFAHRITNPNFKVNKVYEVTLDRLINNYEELLKGVIIKDGNNNDYLAKALLIERINDNILHITINEGKFHQVRRMFEKINYKVINLKRIKIGNLELADLKPGEYQFFKEEDFYDGDFNASL